MVVDSWTISLGLSILVEAAARAAIEGASLDEVVRLVRGMIPHIYAVFFTDTLDYLKRDASSERIPGNVGHNVEYQAVLGS